MTSTVLEQASDDENVRRLRSQVLARRRRRSLAADAPDVVTVLRQMRGYAE